MLLRTDVKKRHFQVVSYGMISYWYGIILVRYQIGMESYCMVSWYMVSFSQ